MKLRFDRRFFDADIGSADMMSRTEDCVLYMEVRRKMTFNRDQWNIHVMDHSPIAYSVVELILDDDDQPVDWIYRYCNQAFADVKGYTIDILTDNSFLNLFPSADEKWLKAYYQAAYEDKSCEIDSVSGDEHYPVTVAPVGMQGFCSCMIGHAAQQTDMQIKDVNRLKSDKYVMDKLSMDYVSVYRIELNSGAFETLRLISNTNAKQLIGKDMHRFKNFDVYAKQYADYFILEEDKDEFMDWFSCRNMKKRLSKAEKITYHYRSVSVEHKYCFFEAYASKGYVDQDHFYVFLGFRNVDSILYKEKAIQEQLQKTIDEVQLRNEIISAIAKTYHYISRIDIQADYYEEITNTVSDNRLFGHSGSMSENVIKVGVNLIAKEYRERYLQFVDLKTLPDRMKDEATIITEYKMKDGNWHTLRFIEKKRDENGKLTHVICAIRSISDIKKREQDLRFQAEKAQKDAAMKRQFLSNMSHDIRTPMNGIIGMVDLANHYPDNLEIQQKCRDKIMESSKYLVALLNDILDMNKLESDDLVNHEITFDLTELLSKANANSQMQAADKKIAYIVDWDRAEVKHPYLVGNPIYLERLLSIISDNAVKFTNPGGSVHVWCLEMTEDKESAVFEFGCEDNGIGMSEEFLAHAFDMFSQENASSRSHYEGSGLGLAIAKQIAERLGGTISIQSQKGRGTTVTVRLPFAIGQPEQMSPLMTKRDMADYATVPVKGLRVLVAEDNELNMEIAQFVLEKNGIIVDCARDGREAVEIFEKSAQHYYDVIFMDIMMPYLSGWDATRKIRAMKRVDAEIPIIAMSANAFAEDIINSRISGMNEHLTKPLDESKMIDALKKCVAGRRFE